jgi:stage V sporulation protein G
MEITEIRIKLMESSEDRLRAFCSITIDESFVVRDLKIIDGTSGPFVAMPSRKLSGHCQRCHHKNHLRAAYCNNCGAKLKFESGGEYDSPQKLYADVAHPINSECREMIQNAVIEEFEAELARSNEPGYRSRYDDDFDQAEVARGKAVAGEIMIDSAVSDSNAGSVKPPKFSKTAPKKGVSDTVSSDAKEDDPFGEGIF